MATIDPTPARELLRFIDESPTPWHAVVTAERRLRAAGFRRLDETRSWQLAPGDAVYLVRGGGTLVAARLGSEPPSEAGFVLVGAHTDSPGLRIKPTPLERRDGVVRLGVETYGGVLWHTWLDRDLTIAGRVVLADGSTALVRLPSPCCRIASLAIHLNRAVNESGLTLNPENDLKPMLCLDGGTDELLGVIAAELGASLGREPEPSAIRAYDLCLVDTQPSAVGGADGSLIFAPRLDNLASCDACLTALIGARPRAATQVAVLYDHEEVGSESAHGAASRLLLGVLERLAKSQSSDDDGLSRALARSLVVSVDMAHAVHPAFGDKHDPTHRPLLGGGPVLKSHASQAYATDSVAAATFLAACEQVGVTPQRYVARADIRCGSTIGPIAAARLGVRTVDVGSPMLSMHSCRELAAVRDVEPMRAVLGALLSDTPLPAPDL